MTTPTTELVVASKPLNEFLGQNQLALESALQGKPIILGEFVAALDNAVAMDEALAECVDKNPRSVKNAILTAAMLGLRPGPVHKHFALTCFKVKGKPTCVGIPEWRGLIEVANQADALETSIVVDVVYEHEVKSGAFKYDRHTEEITHEIDLLEEDADKRTDDKLVAAYATCRVKGRKGFATVVLKKSDVHKRRATSASWKAKGERSTWGTNTVPMWKKSAVRALLDSGKVPMSRNHLLADIMAAERQVEEVIEEEVIKPAEVIEQKQEPEKAATPATETGQQIVDSAKPPKDETVIWRNSRTERLYQHDGSNWVPYEEED